MKKKLVALLLVSALAFVGCGASQQEELSNQQDEQTELTDESGLQDTNEEETVLAQGVDVLKVVDGKLCNEAGEPVQLKGVSTHAVTRVEPFINGQLFQEMHSDWGVDVVRLAMYTEGQDGYMKSDYFREKNVELVKKGVDLAVESDLYVLVDWHILDDRTPLKYKDAAIDFFDMISKEYADCPNVIYEICNEPNDTSWADIKAYANEVIPVIRANAPDSVIICGTPDWSQGVDQALADPLEFENVMYTLHFYSASHKDDLRNRMITCAEAGLPIFVTEYGVTASNGGFPRDLEEADVWMAALDEYGISSCIWNLSKNGEACCLLSSSTTKYSGFADEDYNETGQWFIQMLESK